MFLHGKKVTYVEIFHHVKILRGNILRGNPRKFPENQFLRGNFPCFPRNFRGKKYTADAVARPVVAELVPHSSQELLGQTPRCNPDERGDRP